MEKNPFQAALNGLVGHSVIDMIEDKKNFNRRGELLTETSFKMSANDRELVEVSTGRWQLYGQAMDLTSRQQDQADYSSRTNQTKF